MSTTFTTQADRIAQLGASAGAKLWLAIEDAYEAGMLKPQRTFECALEQITEEIDCEFKAKLFSAAAMQAIPIVLLSTSQRKAIDNAAADAWFSYVRFLQDEHAQETADHYADMAREYAA